MTLFSGGCTRLLKEILNSARYYQTYRQPMILGALPTLNSANTSFRASIKSPTSMAMDSHHARTLRLRQAMTTTENKKPNADVDHAFKKR